MKDIIRKYLNEEVESKQQRYLDYIINDYLSKVKFLLVDELIGDIWVKLPHTDSPTTQMDIIHIRSMKEALPGYIITTLMGYGLTMDDFSLMKGIWREITRRISIKMREIYENKDKYKVGVLYTIDE